MKHTKCCYTTKSVRSLAACARAHIEQCVCWACELSIKRSIKISINGELRKT